MLAKLILVFLASCSLMDYIQAEIVYAAVSGLPMNLTPPPAGQIQPNFKPPLPQEGQLLRPQRSLYGGWQGPPIHPHPIGLGHITKQELITLLEAAKEVYKPAPEPALEPEPEPEPAPEPESGPAPEPAGPPAGVPLTVSLPAFVPIQLSAMYTAPPPPAAPEASAAAEEEPEEEEDEEDEEEEEEEEEIEEEPAAIIKPYHPVYNPWPSRGLYGGGRIVQYQPGYAKKSKSRTKSKSSSKSRKSKSKRSKSKSKSRSKKRNGRKLRSRKNILHYAPSQQTIQALPPPPFLSRAPGPLKLVPSNQLFSNWN